MKTQKARNDFRHISNEDMRELQIFFAEQQTILSKERTILSFLRTGIAIILAGIAIINFFENIRSQIIGWALIVLGVYEVLESLRRLHKYQKLMRKYKGVMKRLRLQTGAELFEG